MEQVQAVKLNGITKEQVQVMKNRISKFTWLALFGKDKYLLRYLSPLKMSKRFRELMKLNNQSIGTYASLLILKMINMLHFKVHHLWRKRMKMNCLRSKLFHLSDEAIRRDYERSYHHFKRKILNHHYSNL
jgi:hypothetical protein